MLAIEVKIKEINGRKIREYLKRKNVRSLGHAVNVVRKFAQRSIRKRAGRVTKYDLKAWIPDGKGGEKEIKMSEHLRKEGMLGSRARIIRGRGLEANPKEKGELVIRKGSRPGSAPYSWKARQPGWKDYYLRNAIKSWVDEQNQTGYVFSNPHKNSPVPAVLEKGGSVLATRRRLIGYRIRFQTETNVMRTKGVKIPGTYRRKFKQTRVKYAPIRERISKRITMQARPYLEPALVGTLKDLPAKWR